jgi:thiamine kinase-like enzyme
MFILLEDLDHSGFPTRLSQVSMGDVKTCLSWLAHFHALFMGQSPDNLWEEGTYWHLATRPDELQALQDSSLKQAATIIDRTLRESPFQTFVHGDAKLANFCFSDDGKDVAAVDFQYVGGGCGMKDVVYFIGSCLDERQCQQHEVTLLDFYFDALKKALAIYHENINPNDVEHHWRPLYHVAWTDFHRFIKGWSPGHWKINGYSEKIAREVILQLTNNE